MALGDIVSCVVRPDGWSADVTIDGFVLGATYDFGLGTNNANVAGSKFAMTVVSEGYNSSGTLGTVTRTVYGTALVRMPYGTNFIAGTLNGTFTNGETVTQTTSGATAVVVGASQGANDAGLSVHTVTGSPDSSNVWTGGTSGFTVTPSAAPAAMANDERVRNSNLVCRVALSEFVYNDDKSGGAGTSGTDPTVDIAAGWCVNAGGSSESSVVANDLACTNSSTLDYAKAFGQWDHIAGVCTADRVKANFNVAFNARHRSGIAAVVFNATGVTSAHAQSATVTTQTATKRTATNLYGIAHVGTITLSGFTQAELIDLRARIYPVVGDADSVMDTDALTAADDEPLGWRKATIVCDKDNALDDAVYVATDGNDTTGNGTSGAPYATIGKAVQNGNIVYLKAGTHAAVGLAHSRVATNEWIIAQPAPGESSSTVTVQVQQAVKNPDCQRMMFANVKMTIENTSSYLSGEDQDDFLRFVGCIFDSAGVARPSVCLPYNFNCAYFHNCTGDLGEDTWRINTYSNTRVAVHLDGCELAGGATYITACYRCISCSAGGKFSIADKAAANPAPSWDGIIIENNKFGSYTSTGSQPIYIGMVAGMPVGASICGNLIEKTAGTSGAFVVAGSNIDQIHHILIWHNSVAGERSLLGYNDAGTASASRLNWSVKFNAFRDFNNKDDTFATENANRIGSWPVGYGVGFYGNRYEISNFPGEFSGLDTALVGNDAMGYVDDQSYTGGGAGNGDYHPAAGSALRDRIAAAWRVFIADLYGTAIADDGTGDGGAVQAITVQLSGGATITLSGGSSTLDSPNPGDIAGTSQIAVSCGSADLPVAVAISGDAAITLTGGSAATTTDVALTGAAAIVASGDSAAVTTAAAILGGATITVFGGSAALDALADGAMAGTSQVAVSCGSAAIGVAIAVAGSSSITVACGPSTIYAPSAGVMIGVSVVALEAAASGVVVDAQIIGSSVIYILGGSSQMLGSDPFAPGVAQVWRFRAQTRTWKFY